MMILKTASIFILAGLCEIGGGYLVWLWLKENKSPWLGFAGFILLGMYGIVATFQPANFARTYATYGGVFIAMSLLWAMKFDSYIPDRFDLIGAFVALVGVGIIYYAPR
ncbi:integral membrane protein, PF02694 family [Leptospira yanagawae serovar Saopaulo str. Sao Paulo = ATCC 700523]|uniref:Integral membrane protein, PF02694 family n=1 Tax=Leptospira yanagawae serovar Saopaulo str. Sao Paulo = ATCC 700523 TaxID=1249483 RepID=A0A5E8HHH8_9LEPT|nr:YnfA family protein [Leptospira yanagawae]EOQ90729.1 integral membrane protein, PF02694 family [Leptospira yanagawae serovar Saopaulo str. Sao Paulo = ATCC 700523]